MTFHFGKSDSRNFWGVNPQVTVLNKQNRRVVHIVFWCFFFKRRLRYKKRQHKAYGLLGIDGRYLFLFEQCGSYRCVDLIFTKIVF